MHFLKSAQPNPFCSISSPPLPSPLPWTHSCCRIIYEEEMCLSIWPTYRRSFRRGWWLVTHCIVLSALGHDNEAEACVWSASAAVADSSEKWTQLHNWQADGSQVLRSFKSKWLIHEPKNDAQLWVTSMQLQKSVLRWNSLKHRPADCNKWSEQRLISGFCSGGKESSLFLNVTQGGLILTDVSGKPIGPIFKRQAVREELLDSWW